MPCDMFGESAIAARPQHHPTLPSVTMPEVTIVTNTPAGFAGALITQWRIAECKPATSSCASMYAFKGDRTHS